MDWKVEAERLYFDENKSITEVTDAIKPRFADKSWKQCREMVWGFVRFHPRRPKTDKPAEERQNEIRNDGTAVSTIKGLTADKFSKLQSAVNADPSYILTLHGFDPKLWEIVNCVNNYWNSQLKGGALQVSYQSKLTAKPKKQGITFEDIDRYFETKEFKNKCPITHAAQYDPDGEILEICLPDLHSGLLAWRKETGQDYDVHIMQQKFNWCIADIIQRCKGKKLKKIYLVTLGDLLHFDNENQTTTKGTFQQADGRLSKIFDTTQDMVIDTVEALGDIAPVEVIYLPGNHDRVTGYTLIKGASKAFRHDKNIIFDTEPNPQKRRLIGVNLIGWTHGDMPKQNIANWLQHSARKEYGLSKFAEVHAGHFHSLTTKETKRDFIQEDDIGGVIIRYLPTISSSSYWEHHEGYTSGAHTMMCFVWNESTGLRETWRSNVI